METPKINKLDIGIVEFVETYAYTKDSNGKFVKIKLRGHQKELLKQYNKGL
jgi:hypothetical protein